MRTIRFFNLIGMSGVARHERIAARHCAQIFELLLIPVAGMTMIMWYDLNQGTKIFSTAQHSLFNWAICSFFALETLSLTALVKQRRQYLLGNWFNILLILILIPWTWEIEGLAILRLLRFMLIGFKLIQLSNTLRTLLSRNNLGITILACWLFAFGAGVLIAAIDPGINSIADGIWWAWVTVTTVGYGDVVPVSTEGRILGGVLMLIGMGLFSIFTAHFSAFLVSREEEKIVAKEQQVLAKESELLLGEQHILHTLSSIEKRLGKIEEQLNRDKRA